MKTQPGIRLPDGSELWSHNLYIGLNFCVGCKPSIDKNSMSYVENGATFMIGYMHFLIRLTLA